jgi:hypothetical protein
VARTPTFGVTDKQAAGCRDSQAYYRRYRDGQAANEEGAIEGWTTEHRAATATVWIDVGLMAGHDRHWNGLREVIGTAGGKSGGFKGEKDPRDRKGGDRATK